MYPHSYSPGRLWFLSRPFLIAVLASFPHIVHFQPHRKSQVQMHICCRCPVSAPLHAA